MNHEILRGRVEAACQKIAEYGVEGCEDKEIILACFGMVMFNGIESLRKSLNRTAWAVSMIGVTAIISILLAVLLG